MGFRVGVKLSRYFSDERRAALVYIEEPLQRVYHLEQYLRDLFQLDGAFCLLKDDFLLPSTQNLHVLQCDDAVTVIPLTTNFNYTLKESETVEENIENVVEKDVKKKKRKKVKEVQEDSVPSDDTGTKAHNKKNNRENSPTSSPEAIIKKRHSNFDDPEVASAMDHIKRLHAALLADREDLEENGRSRAQTVLKEIIQPNVNGISDGRVTKRKRVRIRKNKKNSISLNEKSLVSSLSDGESNPPNLTNALALLNGKIGTHIRFPQNENSTVTVLRNKCKIDEKPRIIKPIQSSSSESENLNNLGCDENNDTSAATENKYTVASISNKLDTFPIMNTIPKKDDVIIFKMLKLDEVYNPTISGSIVGKVTSVCSESLLVRLLILDGHSECIETTGKFDVDDVNCTNLTINNEFDLTWNRVIEAREVNM